jgi:Tol biopolymer transport system component
MTPERWEQIKDLFQAALDLPPEQRPSFLDQACGDEALRAEVDRLLEQYEQTGSFLENPPFPSPVSASPAESRRTFSESELVADRFKIIRFIGQGGMGEVYAAEDLELHERVALKTLLPEIAGDPHALERLKREIHHARRVAHPNVCRVFDLGRHRKPGGAEVAFLTMELLPGETLAERLKRLGRMSATEAWPLAEQMAAGLNAAHEAGVVHRDFKPSNVILVETGGVNSEADTLSSPGRPGGVTKLRAVITDFGLARAANAAAGDRLTGSMGGILGTPDYMAPEQVEGGSITPPTDIYAFGIVLYEMVTGALPFTGGTPLSRAVKRTKEPPASLRAQAPDLDSKWEAAILRCLERDPSRRFRAASDVAKALQGEIAAGERPLQERAAPTLFWARRSLRPVATFVVIALILTLALAYLSPAAKAPVVQASNPLTHDGHPSTATLATDGPRLYFLRDEGAEAKLMTASVTDGAYNSVLVPFQQVVTFDVSPDGSEFVVEAVQKEGEPRKLWVWTLMGGAPRRLGGLQGSYPAWSPDGERIAYCHGDHIWVANKDGSEPRLLTTLPGSIQWPRWSPDGKVLRFTACPRAGYLETNLWEVSADGTGLHELLPGWNTPALECCGTWTPDGKYYVFQSERDGRTDLWALREKVGPFHWGSRKPIPLTQGPISYCLPIPSRDGKRLFALGQDLRAELERYDRQTRTFVPCLSGIPAIYLDFSRDGKYVAYIRLPEKTLWRSRVDGSDARQLTSPSLAAVQPHWKPDGRQIAFMTTPPVGPYKLWLTSFDGGDAHPLVSGEGEEGVPTWREDGKCLVFGDTLRQQPSRMAIHLLNLETYQLTTLPNSEGLWTPRWSPDGRTIAALVFNKNNPAESLELRLFHLATQKWTMLVKLNSIQEPAWSRDSQYIYFHTVPPTTPPDPALYRVRISDRHLERLASLKNVRYVEGWSGVAPDGSPLITRDVLTEIYALDVDWP